MERVYPLPTETEVSQMLGMLFGSDFKVDPADSIDGKQVVASFINDDDQAVCVCAADYNCAAFVGAALTKIPPGGAEDAAQTGDFSEMMIGNIAETMNICSRLFMDADSPHLRLDKVYMKTEDAPEDVRGILESDAARVNFSLDIPNYGSGVMSLVST